MTKAAQAHSRRMLREAKPEAMLLRHKRAAKQLALDAAAIFQCRPEAIFRSYDHRAEVVLARRYVIHRLKNEHGWSLPRIGRSLGCDHTSVLYALRQPFPGRQPTDDGPIPCPDESGIWAI